MNLDYNTLRVRNLYRAGMTSEDISDHMNISQSEIKEILIHLAPIHNGKLSLGYKDEPYYAEDEMLLGYVAPSYNELSIQEKIMYHGR